MIPNLQAIAQVTEDWIWWIYEFICIYNNNSTVNN